MTQPYDSRLFRDAAELGLNKVTPWNIMKTGDNLMSRTTLSKMHTFYFKYASQSVLCPYHQFCENTDNLKVMTCPTN